MNTHIILAIMVFAVCCTLMVGGIALSEAYSSKKAVAVSPANINYINHSFNHGYTPIAENQSLSITNVEDHIVAPEINKKLQAALKENGILREMNDNLSTNLSGFQKLLESTISQMETQVSQTNK